MWHPLINTNNLQEGSRLRIVVLDGAQEHESTYVVTTLGNHWYFVRQTAYNNQPIAEPAITPYKINNIIYHGFEIWVE